MVWSCNMTHVEKIQSNFRKMKSLNINESSVFYSFIRSTVAVVNAVKEITKDFNYREFSDLFLNKN